MLLLLLSLTLCCNTITCANIICIFLAPRVSHQMVNQRLWRTLSGIEHNVTVLTLNPIKDTTLANLTEIDLSFGYKVCDEHYMLSGIQKDFSITTVMKNVMNTLNAVALAVLVHPPVQAMLREKSSHFDVMIVDFYHPLMYALSAKFQCPFIGVSPIDVFITEHDAVGNPTHPVLNPDVFLPLMGCLTFKDRVHSTIYSIWFRFYYLYGVTPNQDKLARQHISDSMPYLGDIERNVSLLFLNNNPILRPIRPVVPATIVLWNIRYDDSTSFPEELKKELDEAEQGVVYISFGSNVKSSDLPEELRQKMIDALTELPYKVLWKWEKNDSLPNQPKNVLTSKWFPQKSILGHKNVKAFVMQGGLQSMDEAICNGVPIVVLPLYGDQSLNAGKMASLGIARVVNPTTLERDEFKQAIIEVAENPKYRKAIQKVSELLSDVPMTGLELVVWWTDYVIRHNGVQHFRSPAIDMQWYKYFLVDVICLLLLFIALCIFVAYKVICLITYLRKQIFSYTTK